MTCTIYMQILNELYRLVNVFVSFLHLLTWNLHFKLSLLELNACPPNTGFNLNKTSNALRWLIYIYDNTIVIEHCVDRKTIFAHDCKLLGLALLMQYDAIIQTSYQNSKYRLHYISVESTLSTQYSEHCCTQWWTAYFNITKSEFIFHLLALYLFKYSWVSALLWSVFKYTWTTWIWPKEWWKPGIE